MQLRDVQRLIKPFGDVASASSPDKQQILQKKAGCPLMILPL